MIFILEEVRKEWDCDICQLTIQTSTAKKTKKLVEGPKKNVSTKGVKQRTITNQKEKQQG